jgi:hypothetical protein
MKPKIILCLALVLSGVLVGCSSTPKSPNFKSSAFLQTFFQKIEQQLPELVLAGITTGTSSSAEAWKGEEYATAGFALAKDATHDPRELARQGIPNLCLGITVHRYVSFDDAQKDLEKSFHSRPALPPPKEVYKGAALYRYASQGENVICQSGLYIIEITPMPRNGIAQSLVMNALDIMLAELDSISTKSK